MKFQGEDFCLKNETAKLLYNKYAKALPIIDYHCHLDPKDIYEDKVFKSLPELWLSGDHYKWRLMRANGVAEEYITGKGDDNKKLHYWAETLENCIGNPVYAWCHMELKKYFDYEGVLDKKTADDVISWCEKYFKEGRISARKLIEESKVTHICTTDDPVSDLKWHRAIREDESFKTKVMPSWRPDGILGIEKESFKEYIEKLGRVTGIKIECLEDLKTATVKRIEFFNENGCRVSDHGLEECFKVEKSPDADDIFKKVLEGYNPTEEECIKYKGEMLLFMAGEYVKHNWAMQLHYGCSRNVNTKLYKLLGTDTGIDCINPCAPSRNLAVMLDGFLKEDKLPKTIVYSLDPSENDAIDTTIGCFQGLGKGYIQHGAAWWFSDHKKGIETHLESLGANGVLGNFIGMLTDSRSFVSYTRHDYFRRILCSLLGKWAEEGEYPLDEEALGNIIENICYYNASEYFGFK